jgi:protein O-GlcNAc transferase
MASTLISPILMSHLQLGMQYLQTGNAQQANAEFRMALQIDQDNVQANYACALASFQLDRLADAEQFLRCVIQLQPHFFPAFNTLGVVLRAAGKDAEGIASLEHALAMKPDYAEAAFNLALAFADMKERTKATNLYRRVLSLRPDFMPAMTNLGNLLRAENEYSEALLLLEKVHKNSPNNASAEINMTLILADLGRYPEAIAAGERATKLEPASFETWEALGHAQLLAGDSGRGVVSLSRANELHPNVPQLQYDLGVAQIANGDLAKGRAILDLVEVARPDWIKILFERDLALPPLYESQHHIAESRSAWIAGLEKIEARLFASETWAIDEAMTAVSAHSAFYLNYQDTDNTVLQQRFARVVEHVVQRAYPQFCLALPWKSGTHGGRLRVGFTSAYLRKHSVGYFFGAWITKLDQTKFESFVWHTGEISDAVTEKIRAHSANFSPAPHSMAKFAEAIIAAKLDVLIHLDVGMHPHAQVMAAMRLAPVQCVAYGHPVTTGLSSIDYYLSADAAEPENAQAAYSEKLIRLPKLGVCYPLPDISRRTLPDMLRDRQKAQGQKARKKPFLVCVQRLFKVLPHMDSLVAQIARQLPGCKIAFFASLSPGLNEVFVKRVTAAMRREGVDATTTLQILPAMTYENFLGTVEAADLVLDTTHFSGGNSSFDAFAVGTPVVAYEGAMMRARQTSAMLRIMNIPELIADSDEAYVANVVTLAKDPERLRAIRARILAGRDALFNDVSTVRALEETLVRISARER